MHPIKNLLQNIEKRGLVGNYLTASTEVIEFVGLLNISWKCQGLEWPVQNNTSDMSVTCWTRANKCTSGKNVLLCAQFWFWVHVCFAALVQRSKKWVKMKVSHFTGTFYVHKYSTQFNPIPVKYVGHFWVFSEIYLLLQTFLIFQWYVTNNSN